LFKKPGAATAIHIRVMLLWIDEREEVEKSDSELG